MYNEIEYVGFSPRAYRCLHAGGIDALLELSCYTEKQLLKFRNLGKETIKEIKLVLELNDLKLTE